MKNFIIAIVGTVFISFAGFAQSFHGQAVYLSKKIINDIKLDGMNMPDAKQVEIINAIKKANEKTFLLNFKQHESTYEQEQTLQKPAGAVGEFSVSVTSTGDLSARYTNTKTNQILQEQESMNGKKFLTSDILPTFDWKISGETKKIGVYNCLKATATIRVTAEQIANYEEQLKKQAKKPSAFFKAQPPTNEEITAWFTSDIPVNLGPGKYWGLPGLILEVTSGKNLILCSKIVINPKNKSEVKVPSNGKIISQKEYDLMQKKMFDSMKNEDGLIIHEIRTEK